jgi:flavin reductase (DIM6/NTAB) family NADH-FMN oxidoreductase RutF
LPADPPILALGVENHPDMPFRDTGLNIRLTEVFTVNIVSHAITEAMHVCAMPFGADHDELQSAGLTAMPGTRGPGFKCWDDHKSKRSITRSKMED